MSSACKGGTLQVVVRREDADFGGDGDVVSDGNTAAVVEAALLVDDTAFAHCELAFAVEPSIHENVTVQPDHESKNISVVAQPNAVGWNACDRSIRQVKQGIETGPVREIERLN